MSPKQDAWKNNPKKLILPCRENMGDYCHVTAHGSSQYVLDVESFEDGTKTLIVLSIESQKELFEYLKKHLEHVQASEEGGGSPKSEPVPQLKKWRCTISSRYPWGTPGYKDFSVRQGYYFDAPSAGDALEHMIALFPDESIHDFSVEEYL